MEYRNLTNLPSLCFDAVTPDRTEFHVIVLRVTHDILPDGSLRLAANQTPLVMSDEYHGELGKSSLKQESDLAAYKPKCDVIVNGQAAAPGGAATRFEAGLKMSSGQNILIDKRVTVTGPRFWKKRFLPFTGWKLTAPEPVHFLPLRYEYAYGGECRVDRDKKPNHSCYEANPVGRGFAERWYRRAKKPTSIPAPQIESPSQPIRKFGKLYSPKGFGLLAKESPARRKLAGTIDEAFIQSGKALPEDFDFSFWNGAPADQQIPWPTGGETVELFNLAVPAAPLVKRFVLPKLNLCAKVLYESEDREALDFHVDTLFLDLDNAAVTTVYRLKIPLNPGVESVEALFLNNEARAALTTHCREVTQRTRAAQEVTYAG